MKYMLRIIHIIRKLRVQTRGVFMHEFANFKATIIFPAGRFWLSNKAESCKRNMYLRRFSLEICRRYFNVSFLVHLKLSSRVKNRFYCLLDLCYLRRLSQIKGRERHAHLCLVMTGIFDTTCPNTIFEFIS